MLLLNSGYNVKVINNLYMIIWIKEGKLVEQRSNAVTLHRFTKAKAPS